jgi:hypothetical protein
MSWRGAADFLMVPFHAMAFPSKPIVLLLRPSRAASVTEVILVRSEKDFCTMHFCLTQSEGAVIETVTLRDYHRLHSDTPGLRIHESPDAYMHEQIVGCG